MNIEKRDLKGSEARAQLQKLNAEYTTCISKDFLTQFLNGQNVRVENFCVKEREAMEALDRQIYGKLPFWFLKIKMAKMNEKTT